MYLFIYLYLKKTIYLYISNFVSYHILSYYHIHLRSPLWDLVLEASPPWPRLPGETLVFASQLPQHSDPSVAGLPTRGFAK